MKTPFLFGWGTVIRTQECRSQSPMPYRLAIPQYQFQLCYHIRKFFTTNLLIFLFSMDFLFIFVYHNYIVNKKLLCKCFCKDKIFLGGLYV